MNGEFKIIARRPLTFWAHVMIGASAVLVPLLDQYKTTPLGEISLISWIIIVTSTLAGVANTVKAWFSSSAQKAKEELQQVKEESNP